MEDTIKMNLSEIGHEDGPGSRSCSKVTFSISSAESSCSATRKK
jgi:hypothetical protein